MKVFITGGTGFVGNAVIDSLLGKQDQINALVNDRPLRVLGKQAKSFKGTLFDNAVLDQAMNGCDAVIHLVGIIAEDAAKKITFDRIHYQGTKQVVDATKRAGIKRYMHMSAIGASAEALSKYQRTKFKAEEYVRQSGLDWTIIRPSLIHGPGGDFIKMEERWARGIAVPFLFMPYFANGFLGGKKTKIQPVFVGDVARAFAQAMEDSKTIHRTIEIGGPDQMTWPQMHHKVAQVVVGKKRPTLGVPAWYARALTIFLPKKFLPFTRDQVLMSQQDNICDLKKFEKMFGWAPQAFEPTLLKYMK